MAEIAHDDNGAKRAFSNLAKAAAQPSSGASTCASSADRFAAVSIGLRAKSGEVCRNSHGW
jgi:hypothetical protein